jgi:hypothetical protein
MVGDKAGGEAVNTLVEQVNGELIARPRPRRRA